MVLFGTAATSQSHVGEAGMYAETTAQRFFRRDAATRSPGNEKNKKHAEPTAFRTASGRLHGTAVHCRTLPKLVINRQPPDISDDPITSARDVRCLRRLTTTPRFGERYPFMAETPERFANMPPSSHTPTKAWDAGAEEPSCGVLCDRCIRHKPCASYQCSFYTRLIVVFPSCRPSPWRARPPDPLPAVRVSLR